MGNQLRAQAGYSLEFWFGSISDLDQYSDLDFFLSFFKYFLSICYVPSTLANKTDMFLAIMSDFCLECLEERHSPPTHDNKETWV